MSRCCNVCCIPLCQCLSPRFIEPARNNSSVPKEEPTQVSYEAVPGDTRWTISAQAMSGAMIAQNKAMYDAVGKKAYNAITGQIWGKTGQGAKQVADMLGLKAENPEEVAKAFGLISIIALGPELKTEIVESTPEKTVMRGTGCPFYNRVQEFGIAEDLLTAGDGAYCEALTYSLNPNVTVTHEKRMHRGDPYCEWIFEVKK